MARAKARNSPDSDAEIADHEVESSLPEGTNPEIKPAEEILEKMAADAELAPALYDAEVEIQDCLLGPQRFSGVSSDQEAVDRYFAMGGILGTKHPIQVRRLPAAESVS